MMFIKFFWYKIFNIVFTIEYVAGMGWVKLTAGIWCFLTHKLNALTYMYFIKHVELISIYISKSIYFQVGVY